jgi:lysophospholipase L1-like esterase
MSDVDTSPTKRSPLRRIARALVAVAMLLAVSAASIAFALQVTPERSVSSFGQTVTVGTAPPTWSTEGPGQVVLFGFTLPTQVRFIGPVRPRLTLTDISINEQVAGLFSPGPHAPVADTLGAALERGWRSYFLFEIGFVAVGATLLLGAIAGWRRFPTKKTVLLIVGGLLFAEAINIGSIMVTAFTAPAILRDVHSLDALVGRAQQAPLAAAPGPDLSAVQAIVLGDSTAAGLGGPPLPHPSASDEACQRSSFAFAQTLAKVNDWKVDNLSCSGATIAEGVLGPQDVGGRRLPAQLAVAKRAVAASTLIVNVGANDLHWSTLIRLCAVADTCDNRALTAYFQRSLATFTTNYLGLLRQLAAMPGDPLILINQYYAPFDPALDCLVSTGLTTEKIGVLLERLATLNEVIANGARTFGYLTAEPDFTGHELCTTQSYVQSEADPAPLHPNARGQLAIALADERSLLDAPS